MENSDLQFRDEALEIARYFDEIGDYQLSEYIMNLLSNKNTFVPQGKNLDSDFIREIEVKTQSLPLPIAITEDLKGIINAMNHHIGINKFLFEGAPGTGKTESVKQIAKILNRNLYMIEFSELIDSKLGSTAKNISAVFKEINEMPAPSQALILLDEIDAIALDRINSNDVREMGRVTSTILKELDNLNDQVALIATTNLFDNFDKALVRRFDGVINFNRYEKEDLIEVAETLLDMYLKQFKNAGRDLRLFKKILNNMNTIPYPGDLKNSIKVCLGFSDPNNEFDYLKRFYRECLNEEINIQTLKNRGFTVREIEKLTGISKSQVSRELRECSDE